MSLNAEEAVLSGLSLAFVGGIGATILGGSIAIINNSLMIITGTSLALFCLNKLK